MPKKEANELKQANAVIEAARAVCVSSPPLNAPRYVQQRFQTLQEALAALETEQGESDA